MIRWLCSLFRRKHHPRALSLPRQCPCAAYGDEIDHCQKCNNTGFY